MPALPNIAAEYLRGTEIGASIAHEHNRLQMEQERLEQQAAQQAQEIAARAEENTQQIQAHAQAQQQVTEREAMMQHERLATEKSYHDQQLGLRKQQLEQAGKVTAAKTQEAAAKMADQKGFADDLAAGMPVDQALFRHPRLTTPANAIAAHKAAIDATGEKLKLSKERLDLAERALKDKEEKPGKIGTMDIPLPVTKGGSEFTPPMMKGVPIDSPLINQVMGTNAPPGTGTNYGGRVNLPVPAAAAATPTAAAKSPYEEGKIVRNKKNNKLYRIVNGQPVPVEEK